MMYTKDISRLAELQKLISYVPFLRKLLEDRFPQRRGGIQKEKIRFQENSATGDKGGAGNRRTGLKGKADIFVNNVLFFCVF